MRSGHSLQSAGQQNLDPPNAAFILAMAYTVFFSRYTVATALSSFFPQKASEIGISSTMNGIIFASYPAGKANKKKKFCFHGLQRDMSIFLLNDPI